MASEDRIRVNFKLLLRRILCILFEKRAIYVVELYRALEAHYKNGEYYQSGRKLYRGRAYRRIQEIERCLKLLGVIKVLGLSNKKIYVLNRAKTKITNEDGRRARMWNKQVRLSDKIMIVRRTFNHEHRDFVDDHIASFGTGI